MTCTTALGLVEPYLDGELDASQNAEVAGHLSECESCATVWQRLRALSDDLHTPALRYEASESLRNRVLESVRHADGTGRPSRMNWLALFVACFLEVT